MRLEDERERDVREFTRPDQGPAIRLCPNQWIGQLVAQVATQMKKVATATATSAKSRYRWSLGPVRSAGRPQSGHVVAAAESSPPHSRQVSGDDRFCTWSRAPACVLAQPIRLIVTSGRCSPRLTSHSALRPVCASSGSIEGLVRLRPGRGRTGGIERRPRWCRSPRRPCRSWRSEPRSPRLGESARRSAR